jgi:regulator of protease activity HflC (stomatin/prohibitin superfamily)
LSRKREFSVLDPLILWSIIIIVGALLLWRMFTTIDQAHVGVVTLFGKYRRILNPGLNILIPFVETVRNKVPVQNRTDQLQFSAITADQAAVHFISTIIFTVEDHTEDTIKLVAFKFIDDASFNTAITSAVEASVREFVATKKQSEVLGLRQEIVTHAKANLDDQLSSWGYLLVDLTVNDIQFDAEVMQSMSRVVAAKNAQTAAEFEGQALLIQRTKEAEAEGAAIRIAAENEATAARLRGEGLAQFREAIAVGFSESAKKLEDAGLDPAILLFSMWTETMRDAAKEGTGNTIFLDGNVTTMEQTMHRLQGILSPGDSKPTKPKK